MEIIKIVVYLTGRYDVDPRIRDITMGEIILAEIIRSRTVNQSLFVTNVSKMTYQRHPCISAPKQAKWTISYPEQFLPQNTEIFLKYTQSEHKIVLALYRKSLYKGLA